MQWIDGSFFIQILTQTPVWVFAIFVVLLVLGLQQRLDRRVTRGKLLIPPTAVLGFSLYSVVTSFGSILLPLLAWSIGLAAVLAIGVRRLRTAAQPIESGVFLVKGSWWPLALMIGIFSVQYALGYAAARNPALFDLIWFVGITSALLGVLGGAFLARAWAAISGNG